MKYLCYTFVALFFSILSGFAQEGIETADLNQYFEDTSRFPIVTGHLENYSPYRHSYVTVDYFLTIPGAKNLKTYHAKIDSGGNFKFHLPYGLPYQQIQLKIGNSINTYLFINKGLHLSLSVPGINESSEPNSRKDMKLSGPDSELNKYYLSYLNFKKKRKRKLTNLKTSYLMNLTAQTTYKVNKIQKVYSGFEKLERNFARWHGKSFLWLLESERETSYYTDLLSIFLGMPLDRKIFNECVKHQPNTFSLVTNQYYDILCFLLSNPSHGETKHMTQEIIFDRLDLGEEESEVKQFLREIDKRNAGVEYDEEFVENGVEKYLSNINEELEIAKWELYIQKLSKLDEEKRKMVLLYNLPNGVEEKKVYMDQISDFVSGNWQEKLLISLNEDEVSWREEMSELMTIRRNELKWDKVGEAKNYLPSGAVLYWGNSKTGKEQLQRLKNVFPSKGIIIGIWDSTNPFNVESLKKMGAFIDKVSEFHIQVVHLCIDNKMTFEQWEKMMTNTAITGDHILMNSSLTSEIINLFDVQYFPAYFYFSKEGKFTPFFTEQLSFMDQNEIEELVNN